MSQVYAVMIPYQFLILQRRHGVRFLIVSRVDGSMVDSNCRYGSI